MKVEPIARVRACPGGSGAAGEAPARREVVFEPAYRDPSALRGVEGFDWLWLIWAFPEGEEAAPGAVFAHAPAREGGLGLSCVALEEIASDEGEGAFLVVSGEELPVGASVFDVKPYLPYSDAHPEAGSDSDAGPGDALPEGVECPPELLRELGEEADVALSLIALEAAREDTGDEARSCELRYAGLLVKFSVAGGRAAVSEVEHVG